MKKALLLLLLLPLFANGQWHPWSNLITFDPGDTVWRHVVNIDTVHYHHNIWQVGKPQKTVFDSAYSMPNAIVTDTLNPYPPNDTSVFILTVPGNANGWGWISQFDFEYQLNMDSTSIARIEFSPDSGRSWINMHDSIAVNFSYFDSLRITPGWHSLIYSINAFAPTNYVMNDSLLFRFTFISGSDTTGKDGWMIDNFHVEFMAESVPTIPNNHNITLYPNPGTTELNIQSTNAIEEVTITNLLGQVMTSPRPSPKEREVLSVDVATWPSGVYFVKVNGVVQKFVKS